MTKTNGQLVADFAFGEVGTKESPANTNRTKYGEWFGYNGVAWCAEFVSYCYHWAGFPLGKLQYKNGIAGCPWAVHHFTETKEIIYWDMAKPGDLVFFDWNGDGRYDHVAIFNGWKDKSAGIMYTIEGNTSLTNQSNGGEVMSRKRSKNNCVFVHPKVLD
jgi:CHAP domain-containing protein